MANAGENGPIIIEGATVKAAGTVPYAAGTSPSNGRWGLGSFPLAASTISNACRTAGALDSVVFLFSLK
jgi:hypothetical protein